jgi:hypothetical protein
MGNTSGRGYLVVALVTAGCAQKGYGARAEEVAVGAAQASMDAQAIIDQYRDDRELADELYNDKVVEIRDYRVDALAGTTATMRHNGFELRLSLPAGAEKKVEEGATIVAVCEGDSLDGEKVIAFERCRVE